jgi:hypothetical protein
MRNVEELEELAVLNRAFRFEGSSRPGAKRFVFILSHQRPGSGCLRGVAQATGFAELICPAGASTAGLFTLMERQIALFPQVVLRLL